MIDHEKKITESEYKTLSKVDQWVYTNRHMLDKEPFLPEVEQ